MTPKREFTDARRLFGGVLIVATAAFVSLSHTEPAHGIEELRERLQSINSLHVKGWFYQHTKTDAGRTPLAFPTEFFYERPYRQYQLVHGFSFEVGEKLSEVTTRAVVSDGEQTMLVDHDKKTVSYTLADKLLSELRVENNLQRRLFEQLGTGDLDEFQKTGVDRVNDIMCNVYEQVVSPDKHLRFRTRIWINQHDSIPVKIVSYSIEPNGAEEIFWEWTEIGINVDPPEAMFSCDVPAGYERVEPEKINEGNRMVTLTGGGGMSSNGKSAAVSSGVALNIDGKAVLYCWAVKTTDKDGPKWFEGQPEFSLEDVEDRPCEEITLRTDDTGEQQARWSLIIPRDRRPWGNASLNMRYSLGRSSSGSSFSPLKFGPKRLADIVAECQQRTLPPNHDPAEIWTLEELRQKLAEIR